MVINKKKSFDKSTLRLTYPDASVVQWNGKRWIKSKGTLDCAKVVIDLFKAHNNLPSLRDSKNPDFFKGYLTPQSFVRGERVNILPDGHVLDKAYSLFAPDLHIHDEGSHGHWDIIFRNPNGSLAYLYSQVKKEKSRSSKFHKVEDFDRVHKTILDNVHKGLNKRNDLMSVPMYTLLKTYMRVGNEIYFRLHGHKGLATLKKSDISLLKGGVVGFDYLGKDGVPLSLREPFPPSYINRLSLHLKSLKNDDFVFTKNNKPLRDTDFMNAFKKYCGTKFYPHIVRSHYATSRVKDFLSSKKAFSKSEVNDLFMSIASKLGHKHYSKKKGEWVDNFDVTIHYYVDPLMLKKVQSRIK